MKYVVDANLMREFESIALYLHGVFADILDDAGVNLDAVYDALSSNSKGGEIEIVNTHTLAKFGEKGEALRAMLEALGESSQWKVSFEPDICGMLETAHINKELTELVLCIDGCNLTFSSQNDRIIIKQTSNNEQNLADGFNILSEFVGKQVVEKSDIYELFGKSGIEIKFHKTPKTLFITSDQNGSIKNLNECVKVCLLGDKKQF